METSIFCNFGMITFIFYLVLRDFCEFVIVNFGIIYTIFVNGYVNFPQICTSISYRDYREGNYGYPVFLEILKRYLNVF